MHSDTRSWRWLAREALVRWSERWITKRDSTSPSRLSGTRKRYTHLAMIHIASCDLKKKRRDVSAMNNVRYIRHFSGCVRFPSVPWRFFINSGGFHCPCRNKKRFHHQALIEVRILEHLRKKDLEANSQHNVIHMLEYFYFRNHLCISFELMRWAIERDKQSPASACENLLNKQKKIVTAWTCTS